VPGERLVAEPELFRPLPSLRPRFGWVTLRSVDKLSTIRIGSARYSVPKRFNGRKVEVPAGEGRIRVLDAGRRLMSDDGSKTDGLHYAVKTAQRPGMTRDLPYGP
jgi:hypothetical protein